MEACQRFKNEEGQSLTIFGIKDNGDVVVRQCDNGEIEIMTYGEDEVLNIIETLGMKEVE